LGEKADPPVLTSPTIEKELNVMICEMQIIIQELVTFKIVRFGSSDMTKVSGYSMTISNTF